MIKINYKWKGIEYNILCMYMIYSMLSLSISCYGFSFSFCKEKDLYLYQRYGWPAALNHLLLLIDLD